MPTVGQQTALQANRTVNLERSSYCDLLGFETVQSSRRVRYSNSEDQNMNLHHRENFRSHILETGGWVLLQNSKIITSVLSQILIY
jgi:hypothetical protein